MTLLAAALLVACPAVSVLAVIVLANVARKLGRRR